MVYFQDAFMDLDNKFLVMNWTWCMPGKQWILRFIWPKNIMGTQYQPRAMIFVLTWYNLISLISHCLIPNIKHGISSVLIKTPYDSQELEPILHRFNMTGEIIYLFYYPAECLEYSLIFLKSERFVYHLFIFTCITCLLKRLGVLLSYEYFKIFTHTV